MILFFLCAGAAQAEECKDRNLSVPTEVRLIEDKDTEGLSLTSSERFLLESFQKDNARYAELYKILYPCAVFADQLSTNKIRPEQEEIYKQELVLIERKWGNEGAAAARREQEESFTDIPDDEFMAVE